MCGSILGGPGQQNLKMFAVQAEEPEGRRSEPNNFKSRLFLFLSVGAGGTCLLVNLLTGLESLWSLFIVGAILLLWLFIRHTIMSKGNIAFRLILQFLGLSVFLVLVDQLSGGYGWALDIVTPFLAILSTLMVTILLFTRRMKWRDYMIYLALTAFLGFAPLILIFVDLVRVQWPAITAAFYSFLTWIGMFLFADKKLKNELIKRFHI